MNPVSQPMGLCPCKSEIPNSPCGMLGTKLTKYGHLVGCGCRVCTGRRSKRKGQRNQASVLKRAAAAEGVSMEVAPTHEEQARLLVHYEVKSGDQVNRAGPKALSMWEKQARDFAERQTPLRKWAVVMRYPGGQERIWMDFKAFLVLVNEIQELP